MPRKYAPISDKNLIEEIKRHCKYNDGNGLWYPWFENESKYGLEPFVQDDLKVEFSWENWCLFENPSHDSFVGIHTMGDFTFYVMWAGGDWETPVYFILYWDGKKLRAYVPTDGNAWNTDTKQAYGNDDSCLGAPSADMQNIRKRYPEFAVKYPDAIEVCDFEADLYDYNKMIADIQKRFVKA